MGEEDSGVNDIFLTFKMAHRVALSGSPYDDLTRKSRSYRYNTGKLRGSRSKRVGVQLTDTLHTLNTITKGRKRQGFEDTSLASRGSPDHRRLARGVAYRFFCRIWSVYHRETFIDNGSIGLVPGMEAEHIAQWQRLCMLHLQNIHPSR